MVNLRNRDNNYTVHVNMGWVGLGRVDMPRKLCLVLQCMCTNWEWSVRDWPERVSHCMTTVATSPYLLLHGCRARCIQVIVTNG